MVSITKIFYFEAAHKLPSYFGKCKDLHGHSYKLEVTVLRKSLDKDGMVMDFKTLSRIVNESILDKYDHAYLNDYFPMPTAELMAQHIFSFIQDYATNYGVTVQRVRLWETKDSYAEVTRRE